MANGEGLGEVRSALRSAGLDSLSQNFKREKIDTLTVCKSLSNRDLDNLGLTTIGDKARFRAAIERISATENEAREESRESIVRERNSLFLPSRNRIGNNNKKRRKQRHWTASFFCFSDNNQKKVPNTEEKECLFKAGLGLKKIKFISTDNEDEVHTQILEQFPKLKEGGGFELMHCSSSCRQLKNINCKWDVKSLKSVVGPQGKFYIRPIQHCLPTDLSEVVQIESNLNVVCENCSKSFMMNEIRDHISTCKDETSYGMSIPHDQNSLDSILPVLDILDSDVELPPVPFDAHENKLPYSNNIEDVPEITYATTAITQSIAANQTDANQVEKSPTQLKDLIKWCIEGINRNGIQDPIHILRYIQQCIVVGRKLDIDAEDIANGTYLTGETNFIVIDRYRLLETAFENISTISDLRLTLEVQFFDEIAEDYGGPRKEFFSLVLTEIYEKYFDPVKEYLFEDYETVGKIFALSMLQNGKLPCIFNEALIEQLLGSNPRRPMEYLKKGMNALGLVEIIQAFPNLVHLLTPEHRPPLSLKMLTHFLKPQFSEVGSNKRSIESLVYQKFVKYMREVAAGRRQTVTLGRILSFTTGVDEEPPLGFSVEPSLTFAERTSFLPTSNTCINRLILTIPENQSDVLDDISLFSKFDYAFSNSYYGLA